MDISIDLPSSEVFIRSYKPGEVTVANVTYYDNLILTPTKVFPDWLIGTFTELTPEAFTHLLALPSDVILLGTGKEQVFLPPSFLEIAANKKKQVDTMTSSAACRTFNLLASEGREVVLGLIV